MINKPNKKLYGFMATNRFLKRKAQLWDLEVKNYLDLRKDLFPFKNIPE